MPTVKAGSRMCQAITQANWMRDSVTGSRAGMMAAPLGCDTQRRAQARSGGHDRRFVSPQGLHEPVVEIEVGLDQLRRRQRQPLVERHVGEVAALEQLEEAPRGVAGVFD